MRIIGCLSWYQESSLWLAAAVSAASKVCDHIVAVDGAYELFPDGTPDSTPEQAGTIQEVCRAHDLGVSIHTPERKWPGEVEKRAFLFRAAELVADPDDWYFVFDADEVVNEVPADFRDRLESAEEDSATARFYELHDYEWNPAEAERARREAIPKTTWGERRFFFRAIPGLTVERNHFTYVTPDGRKLWGNTGDVEKGLDLTDLNIEHRTHFRDLDRRKAAKTYYAKRDEAGVETDDCFHCGKPALNPVQVGWKPVDDRPGEFEALSAMVCGNCLPIAQAQSKQQLRELGGNPDAITYQGVAA